MPSVLAPPSPFTRLTSAPAVIQTQTSGNGGKPPQLGYLSTHTPLFLTQTQSGGADSLKLLSSDFGNAAKVARAYAAHLVSETTMPEDHGFSPMIEKRAGAVALLQAKDGTFYLNELTSAPAWAPSPHGLRSADILIASRRENEPDWKPARSLISMAGAAEGVAAIFAGDKWWDLRAGNALAPTA